MKSNNRDSNLCRDVVTLEDDDRSPHANFISQTKTTGDFNVLGVTSTKNDQK